jgi:hypothetical protein
VANQTFLILVSGPQLPNHHEGSHPPHVELTHDSRGRGRFG